MPPDAFRDDVQGYADAVREKLRAALGQAPAGEADTARSAAAWAGLFTYGCGLAAAR